MFKNKNWAKSTLAAGISSGATSMQVASGTGGRFDLSGYQYIGCFFGSSYASPTLDANAEIVYGAYSTTDTFTLARGQEGTTAKAWSAGDNFISLPTAGKFNEIEGFLKFAQCQVTVSGGNAMLNRCNGNALMIQGVPQIIPLSGVSLAPTGLTAGVNYYLYAFMLNPTTMSLEAVTTAPAWDTTTGMRIKNGDASRTLVAMGRIQAGPVWQDDSNGRYLVSYFNRQDKTVKKSVTALRNTVSSTQVEIAAELECGFICWGDEPTEVWTTGVAYAATQQGWVGIGIDTITGSESPIIPVVTLAVFTPIPLRFPKNLSEGYHFSTVIGNCPGGTLYLNWTAALDAFTNWAKVRG